MDGQFTCNPAGSSAYGQRVDLCLQRGQGRVLLGQRLGVLLVPAAIQGLGVAGLAGGFLGGQAGGFFSSAESFKCDSCIFLCLNVSDELITI